MARIALAFTCLSCLALTAFGDVVVFVDGTRMEVKRYEVKGAMVVLTTVDGKLRSVPSTYVNLEATERANRSSTSTAGLSSAPATPPPLAAGSETTTHIRRIPTHRTGRRRRTGNPVPRRRSQSWRSRTSGKEPAAAEQRAVRRGEQRRATRHRRQLFQGSDL